MKTCISKGHIPRTQVEDKLNYQNHDKKETLPSHDRNQQEASLEHHDSVAGLQTQ